MERTFLLTAPFIPIVKGAKLVPGAGTVREDVVLIVLLHGKGCTAGV